MRARVLVSVEKILSLQEIYGADKIELAHILGWKCCVEKGKFKVNELCAFFTIDSFLPKEPEWDFLEKSSKKNYCGKEGYRIHTVRMRGQISQGLCIPLNDIRQIITRNMEKTGKTYNTLFKEGDDITEALGVIKYDIEVVNSSQGGMKIGARDGKRPEFIPITDETRIQSVFNSLEPYRQTKMYVCEKLDGSSLSAFYKNGKFGVTSRNLLVKRPYEKTWWRILANRLMKWIKRKPAFDFSTSHFWAGVWNEGLEEKLTEYCKRTGREILLQGEILGPGIQKNKYGLTDFEVHLFNMYDLKEKRYCDFSELVLFCKTNGLKHVPIIDPLFTIGDRSVDDLVALSIGNSVLNQKTKREGFVVRPWEEVVVEGRNHFAHNRLSFKVINPEFLLAHDE